MEKFTPLAKILHCRRYWWHGQIPPLVLRLNSKKRAFDQFQYIQWWLYVRAWYTPLAAIFFNLIRKLYLYFSRGQKIKKKQIKNLENFQNFDFYYCWRIISNSDIVKEVFLLMLPVAYYKMSSEANNFDLKDPKLFWCLPLCLQSLLYQVGPDNRCLLISIHQ